MFVATATRVAHPLQEASTAVSGLAAHDHGRNDVAFYFYSVLHEVNNRIVLKAGRLLTFALSLSVFFNPTSSCLSRTFFIQTEEMQKRRRLRV